MAIINRFSGGRSSKLNEYEIIADNTEGLGMFTVEYLNFPCDSLVDDTADNGIFADDNYIYITNGSNLKKYSIDAQAVIYSKSLSGTSSDQRETGILDVYDGKIATKSNVSLNIRNTENGELICSASAPNGTYFCEVTEKYFIAGGNGSFYVFSKDNLNRRDIPIFTDYNIDIGVNNRITLTKVNETSDYNAEFIIINLDTLKEVYHKNINSSDSLFGRFSEISRIKIIYENSKYYYSTNGNIFKENGKFTYKEINTTLWGTDWGAGFNLTKKLLPQTHLYAYYVTNHDRDKFIIKLRDCIIGSDLWETRISTSSERRYFNLHVNNKLKGVLCEYIFAEGDNVFKVRRMDLNIKYNKV